jgi:hypothetical protein
MRQEAAEEAFPRAARDHVKGYVIERGYKFRFETTWLDKP